MGQAEEARKFCLVLHVVGGEGAHLGFRKKTLGLIGRR